METALGSFKPYLRQHFEKFVGFVRSQMEGI